MRYPFRTVAGTPAQQPVNIGVTLLSVPPPAVATASVGAAVGAGETQSYWAFNPTTASGDDTLEVIGGGGAGPTTSTPAGAFVDNFPYLSGVNVLVVAMVRDAPDGAAITWDISTPTVDYGDSPSVSPTFDGFDVYFGAQLHLAIHQSQDKVMAYLPSLYDGGGYSAWALNPITITPSIDGTPLRPLTLTVSAPAWGGF